uniref:CBM1 domain-containing protein n=1 Tax=Moniliophthora roreri TaxID=221103 RepID=A0A0W0FWY4_MONRR
MVSILFTIIWLAGFASAQSPAWGQCGGIGWTGATTCVSGSACVKQNDCEIVSLGGRFQFLSTPTLDYSQCIPGATIPPASTTATSVPVPSGTPPSGANYWFSFGDSYTQTGFEITGTAPSIGNEFGNPPFPGWTSTGNLENWIDFNTANFNKSLILTYNFAYGGATIDANLVKPYDPSVRSLIDQVNIFLNSVGKPSVNVPWTSKNALFSIWIGINDIGNSYYQSGDRGAFSDTLLNAEFALVQKLHARTLYPSNPGNIASGKFSSRFLVPDLTTVYLPTFQMLSQSKDAQTLESTVISGFNSRLATKIASFKSNHSGVTTYLYDSYAGFAKILDNPTSYGFKDATSYGNSPDLFWFNDLHPTSPAHKYFAQDVAKTKIAPLGEWSESALPTMFKSPLFALIGLAAAVSAQEANFWFSFGDSYTQTGFEINGTAPAPGNPLGNPDYPGWTATGGENWVDYGTTVYNKSLVLTYNFAYGGATIDANLVPPYEPTVRSLTDQVNIFLGSAVAEQPESAPWTSENALFSIWIGINDIGNSWYLGGDRDACRIRPRAAAREFLDFTTLVRGVTMNSDGLSAAMISSDDVGARNFLWVNVPPVQRTPAVLSSSDTNSQELEKSVIEGFNSKLETKIEAFKANNSDISTYLYDSYVGFTKILDDPTSYGFRDATTYGEGEDIFWGNDYHPSSYAHKYLAEDVAEVLADTIW